jgi:hypothetical protein
VVRHTTPEPREPYKVVFTPVGWQVVYTREARDPYMQLGLGMEDYRLAKECTDELNAEASA